jgi:hypothetical protein
MRKRWFITSDEELSERYSFGPLVGRTQDVLTQAICPVWGYRPDRRAFHRLAEIGEICIVKAEGHQPCRVYFKDSRLHAEANANMMKIKERVANA